MGIQITQQDDVHIVGLSGRFDAAVVPGAKQSLDQLRDDASQKYVVSLEDVVFLDSAGLAVMVNLLKHARANGGDVSVVWSAKEEANRIITLTKFDKVFKFAASVQEAIGLLK